MLWLGGKTVEKVEVTDAAEHRNGISGKPFTVVLFKWVDGEGVTRNMLGIVAAGDGDNADKPNGECYVLDRDMLADGNIAFGENSWRGDTFETVLRASV